MVKKSQTSCDLGHIPIMVTRDIIGSQGLSAIEIRNTELLPLSAAKVGFPPFNHRGEKC